MKRYDYKKDFDVISMIPMKALQVDSLINIRDQLEKYDEAHTLLKEAYEAIVELLNNEMGGIDKRALRDEAEQWLKENR